MKNFSIQSLLLICYTNYSRVYDISRTLDSFHAAIDSPLKLSVHNVFSGILGNASPIRIAD